MRKRDIPRPGARMLALENALDQMPDPATLTPDQNRRALAIVNEVSEVATRRMIELHVKLRMDEYHSSLPIAGRKRPHESRRF